ncbi:MAG: pyridoxal phosphate-dependent aminotransferase [Candidatus Kariarchaeaceae archaeon]
MISKRVKVTHPPPLVELGQLASNTPSCISLGQGVPFYQPPDNILNTFSKDITNSIYHRYSPDQGIIELREALAKKLVKENGIVANSEEITITPGANQAFVNVLLSIADPGDKIILLTPYYFNHEMACSLANLQTIQIPLNIDYTIPSDPLDTAIKNGAKAVVFVNPGNPTGAVHSEEDIMILRDVLEGRNTWLICDETYEYFTYDNKKHLSSGRNTDIASQTITIGSFSKSFGIPGWRVGFYHGSEEFINQTMKVQDTIGICAPVPSQYLALDLLQKRTSIIPTFHQLMQNNYRIAKDLLKEIDWLEAENGYGAYYLFPKQLTGIPSDKLAHELITEYKVALVPGGGFGEAWKDHLRISFANVSPESLKDAFSKLKTYKKR